MGQGALAEGVSVGGLVWVVGLASSFRLFWLLCGARLGCGSGSGLSSSIVGWGSFWTAVLGVVWLVAVLGGVRMWLVVMWLVFLLALLFPVGVGGVWVV